MKQLLVATFTAAALGAGACRTVRLAPAVDLGAHGKRGMDAKEVQPWLAIFWLRLPQGWGHEFQNDTHMFEPRGPLEGCEDPSSIFFVLSGCEEPREDLPPAALLFWHPEGTYAGAVFFISGTERMDIEWLRRYELRDGFARHIEDPSLAPTRIGGREAFIIRGRFHGWPSTLGSIARHRPHPLSSGDVALAVVHLPVLAITVIVAVVSAPDILSRDPTPSLDIFATCRFFEPRQ